jgi:hypothetical protein
MNMQINADADDDSRVRVNCPSGANGDFSVNDFETHSSQGDLNCGDTSNVVTTSSTSEPYRVQGLIQNGATAGTVQLQMQENGSNDATNGIAILAGSVLQA